MLLSGVTYEPFGPVSGWTWADGTAHTRSYNLRGELAAHSLGGDTRTLTHDDAGRITALADAGTDVRVSYDALHRITGATSHLGTTRPPSQAFTYDANGNRLASVLSGTPPVTVVLDAAGNTLDDGRHSYTYDDRGRLVTVDGTVTYQINALGQRVAKAAAEARLFAYDPAGQLTGEYTTTGTPVTEVIFLGDIPVAALLGASVYQVHADHLNTPRRLVEGGTVRWSWEADVFGAGAAQDDPDGDGTAVTFHWRFPGQYYDAETGHHYNYYRTYDPRTGRYLESDPIGILRDYSLVHSPSGVDFKDMSAQQVTPGLNHLYTYTQNNPSNFTDPFGLDTLRAKVTTAIARGDVRRLEGLLDAIADPKLRQAAQQAIRKFQSKADDWIANNCRGSINREFPEQLRDKTLEEIRQGKTPDHRKAWKLLNDSRFRKP